MGTHNHYFRDVSRLDRVDVYRLLELFGVTCPVAQHVVKKALVAGQRGHKGLCRDWQDIADSAKRRLQMLDEDAGLTDEAIKAVSLRDELPLHGWPEDDSPRQQRIEQGGELAEVYEVLDRMGGSHEDVR